MYIQPETQKTIDVNTPLKIYMTHGFVHMEQPCKIEGCKFITMPNHDDMCIYHWNKKNRKEN